MTPQKFFESLGRPVVRVAPPDYLQNAIDDKLWPPGTTGCLAFIGRGPGTDPDCLADYEFNVLADGGDLHGSALDMFFKYWAFTDDN